MEYSLDPHASMLLEEYREMKPTYERLEQVVRQLLWDMAREAGLYVTAIESRVKAERSLAGKLELKGGKYASVADITDIVGARVITFYNEDVDKVAALTEKHFEVDWENSVDKRHRFDKYSFGYESLHYICRVPKAVYHDPQLPQLNQLRFELQMKTALQHVWATIEHDTGYKKGVEIPHEYLRTLGQLAGMLEMADNQFSHVRASVNDYRRQVLEHFSDGNFDSVPLDSDTFRKYLDIDPFGRLLRRIARINQAEVVPSSSMPYLEALRKLGFKTIGDVERLVKQYSEEAFQLAVSQLGGTDLDIVNASAALQYLLTVYIFRKGLGEEGLAMMLGTIGQPEETAKAWAHQLHQKLEQLSDKRI